MDILDLVNDDHSSVARPFRCREYGCLKNFQRRSDLVRHMRIHSNDRPYNCDWPGCVRTFIQRSALTVHYRVHTGERPHACEHPGCDKAFSDSSSLARHRRIHTGKRPYKCHFQTCLKTFCRKTTLTKHLKRNHGADASSSPASSRGTPYFDYSASTPSSAPSSEFGPDDADYQVRSSSPDPISSSLYRLPPLPKLYHLRSEAMSRRAPQSWSSPGQMEHRETHLTPPPRHHSSIKRERSPLCDSPTCFPYEHSHESTEGTLSPATSFTPSPSQGLSPASLHSSPPAPYLPSVSHLVNDPLLYPSLFSPLEHQPSFFSAPLPQREFHAYSPPPSPTLRARRSSSASAIDFGHLHGSMNGLGIGGVMLSEERSRRLSEFVMMETSEPASPRYSNFRRRTSSGICFPGLPSSLSHNPNPRGSFSSFVTQHIEEMEKNAEFEKNVDGVFGGPSSSMMMKSVTE